MTITSLDARDEYTATGGQTVFNYTFKIYSATDLDIYITPVGQDADDAADITTAYTVDSATIGNEAGGFITLDSGASAGELVTIVSSMPYNRTVDYQNSGDFLPDTVNGDNDRQVSQIKQVSDVAGRSLVFPQAMQGAASLSLPTPDAGLYLAWKGDLSGVENVGAPGSVMPSSLNGTTVQMVADASLSAGDYIITTGYGSAGDGGDNLFYAQAVTGGTADGGSLIKGVGNPSIEFVGLFPSGKRNVKQWGAVGNDAANDTVAIQAAVDAGIADRKEIFFPSGDYLITGPIILDLSAMTTEGDARPNIRGEGRGTTDIHLSGAGAAIAVLGGVAGTAGSHGWLTISDLTLRGDSPVIASSRGLELDNLAYIEVENVAIYLFERGIQATDVLSSRFEKVGVRFCDEGATFEYVDMSRPNAITLSDCVFGACALFGINVVEPGVFNMYGGSIEGCGTALTPGDANGFGLRVINGGTESALSINIDGVYFEGNTGLHDVRITQTTKEAVATIKGCSFARIDNTNYTTYNVSFAPSNDSTLCLLGNGFTELGTYVANAARPYIETGGASGVWSITELGNRFNDQTTAPRNNVLADTSGIAQVRILFDGVGATVNAKNVTAAVTVHAPGDYTVTYAQSMRTISNQIQVTPVDGGTGPFCIGSVHSQTATSCRVQIRDSSSQALVATEGIMVTVHGDMTQGW